MSEHSLGKPWCVVCRWPVDKPTTAVSAFHVIIHRWCLVVPGGKR